MPTSKAQQKAVNKYIKGNYDRINLTVPKGRKRDIEAYAKANNQSVNGLLNTLICTAIGMSEEKWRKNES